jgi:MraZ protein
MFLGEYKHNLDYKGRVSVPKKFRQEIGSEGILTRGLDGCLFLYPASSWRELADKMRQMPLTQADARTFARYIFGGAQSIGFDRLGRISIPDYLRTYASLSKKVVLVGLLDRIEIWDEKKWEQLEVKLKKTGEEVAERLRESGI